MNKHQTIKRKESIITLSKVIFASSVVASVTFFIFGGALFLDERYGTYLIRSCHSGCAVDGKAIVLLFAAIATVVVCEIVKLVASIAIFRFVKRALIQQLVLVALVATIYCLYGYCYSYPVTHYIAVYSAIAYFVFSPVYSWLIFSKNAKK